MNDKTPLPKPIREALHYREYFRLAEASNSQMLNPRLSIAMAHLIIRNVNAGLATNPQHVEGYRALAAAYETLRQNESTIATVSNGGYPNDRRYYQTIQALSQALVIDPNHLPTHRYLMNIYNNQNRFDLVLRELARIDQIRHTMRNVDVPKEMSENEEKIRQSSDAQLGQVRQKIEQLVGESPNFLAAANLAYRNGCVLYALELLERDPQLVLKDPRAQLIKAVMLMESGEGDEAFQMLGQLEGVAEQSSFREWRTPAALSSLGRGDYVRANTIWAKDAVEAEQNQVSAAMQTLPFVGRGGWPLTQTRAAPAVIDQLPRRSAQQWFNVALNTLEMGETQKTAEHLRHLLEVFPETEFRPLVQFYLYQVSDEIIDLVVPSDRIPVDEGLFPDPNKKLEAAVPANDAEGATVETTTAETTTRGPIAAPLPQD